MFSTLRSIIDILTSKRVVAPLLILVGFGGTVIWPLAGLYVNFTLGSVESTLDLTSAEVQKIEQALDEGYAQLDSLETSFSSLEDWTIRMIDIVNHSSSSITLASSRLERIASMLTQASDLWALKLLSPDFAQTLKSTGEDMGDLSQSLAGIGLQEIISELKNVEQVFNIGIQILDFLKNTFKAFSLIFHAMVEKIRSISQNLGVLKSFLIILIGDVVFVHFCLVVLGLTYSRRPSAEKC